METLQTESALKGGRLHKNTKQLQGNLTQICGVNQVRDVHSMPLVDEMSWPEKSKATMRPPHTIKNTAHMLKHYGFIVSHDVIKKSLRIRYPGQFGISEDLTDVAISDIESLFASNGLKDKNPLPYLLNIGSKNPVNPVMDFIQSKPWDGISRFNDLLSTIETRPGYSPELLALLLQRWLISAVAAAAKSSGFWSKGVLVFQGKQSIGKTKWAKRLLPKELSEYLIKTGALVDPQDKDTVIGATSYWIVELGELDGNLRKADNARLKGFISQEFDQFRKPYGRTEEKFPRRTVFFASVNPEEFLTDDTGNVRWWTVPVIGLNYEHDIDMQQLWAEVFVWYEAGEKWWLDQNEEALLEAVNDAHQQSDPIEELIINRYSNAVGSKNTRQMVATQVLLEIGYDRPTKTQLNVAAQALRKLFGDAKRTKKGRFFILPVIHDDGHQYHEAEDEDQPF